MSTPNSELDPYQHDPDRWGVSLAHMASLMLPCLDAVDARYVVEVGAFAGDLTSVLVEWAERSGARVGAIDPSPQEGLIALAREKPALELVRETSLEAIPKIDVPDAVVLDGDHNYYTVLNELRLIEERASGAELPLILFHDVCWPHARRDDYFDIEAIPEEYRQEVAGGNGGVVPGQPGLSPGAGLPYPRSAAHEGGARNGVLTAAEDFAADDERLRLAVVPAFFGLGVLWHHDAPWANAVEELVSPWDGNPILLALEENRVEQLARSHSRLIEIWSMRERLARQEALLERLLASSSFAVAERLSRVRVRAGVATGQAVISKAEIRKALDS